MITKQGHRHTKEPIPLLPDNRSSLSRILFHGHRAVSDGLARFSRPAIPVIHLSRYETGTEPDLDKTLGLLSALKTHKSTRYC